MFSSHREVLLLYDHRLPLDPHQVHGRALHHLRIHSLENSFLWTSIPKFPAFVDLQHGQSLLNTIFCQLFYFYQLIFFNLLVSLPVISVSLEHQSNVFQERKTKHDVITKTIFGDFWRLEHK